MATLGSTTITALSVFNKLTSKGGIDLSVSTGDSPAITFLRGTETDGNVDWKMYVTGGIFKLQNRAGSSTWHEVLSLSTESGGKNISSSYNIIPITTEALNLGSSTYKWNTIHAKTIYEGGTAISSKYYNATISRTKNYVLAAPNGSDGVASFRQLVIDDLPASGATSGSYGPSTNATPSQGGTFSVPYITINNKGLVTAASTKTITLPNELKRIVQTSVNNCHGDFRLKYYTLAGCAEDDEGKRYAGTADNYGFPVTNNANGLLWLGNHSTNYGHQLGFSSNGNIYHRKIDDNNFPQTAKGGSWKQIAFTSSNISGNAATATTATNIKNGAKGSIPYQSGSSTTTFLSAGTSGQVLKMSSSGVPVWSTDNNADTKNTAGATNSDSKMYLIGATSQGANPQTYSNSKVYATAGVLTTEGGINLYKSSGNSPALTFLRGTTADDLVDWRMFVRAGVLKIQNQATTGGWKDILSLADPTSASTITSSYSVLPSANGTLDLGSSSYKWRNIYGSLKGNADTATNVTNVYESKIKWGNTNIADGLSPVDVALDGQWSSNRLSFMPANDILVEYSKNGGSGWENYGLTDAEKQSLVTTGLNTTIYPGKNSTRQKTTDMVRVTITAAASKTYFSLKKIYAYLSTNGAVGNKVKIEKSMCGSDTTFVDVGDYSVSGWPGWNSIPLTAYFGGADTQTSNIRRIRLTFYFTGYGNNYGETDDKSAVKFSISKISMIGETSWANSGGNLPATGHIYSYDISKNVTFPAAVNTDGILTSKGGINLYAPVDPSTSNVGDSPALTFLRGSSTTGDRWVDWKIYSATSTLKIQKRADSTWTDVLSLTNTSNINSSCNIIPTTETLNLGSSTNKWNTIHAKTIYEDGTAISSKYYSATLSRTKNTVLAAPSGSNGVATFRSLVIADLPDSNVTSGSYGPSANVTPSHGGTFSVPYITVNAKGQVTAASNKTITLPATGIIKVYKDNQSYTVTAATSNITANVTSGKYYGVELDKDGKAFVYVPWTDTDTKYTLPTASASSKGGIKVGYSRSSDAPTKHPVKLSGTNAYADVFPNFIHKGSYITNGNVWPLGTLDNNVAYCALDTSANTHGTKGYISNIKDFKFNSEDPTSNKVSSIIVKGDCIAPGSTLSWTWGDNTVTVKWANGEKPPSTINSNEVIECIFTEVTSKLVLASWQCYS